MENYWFTEKILFERKNLPPTHTFFLYISKSVVLPAHAEYCSLIFLPISRLKYCIILKL